MKKILFLALYIILISIFASCNHENSAGTESKNIVVTESTKTESINNTVRKTEDLKAANSYTTSSKETISEPIKDVPAITQEESSNTTSLPEESIPVINTPDYDSLWDLEQKSSYNPAAYVITSAEQLKHLNWFDCPLCGNDDCSHLYTYGTGYGSSYGSFFEADCTIYDDDYFSSNHYLVITYFISSSGGFRYNVDLTGIDDYSTQIKFMVMQTSPTKADLLDGGIGYTCDIGFHCFITEFSGSYTDQEIIYESSRAEGNYIHTVKRSDNIPTRDNQIRVVWHDYSDAGEDDYNYRVVTNSNEIDKLNEFRSSNDYHTATYDGAYPLYDGMNDFWVVYGDGYVVGLYKNIDYGSIGNSIVFFGNDHYLPSGFSKYVSELCK